MSRFDRLPVVVGVGQVRGGDPDTVDAGGPLALWAEAARRAERDAGAALLARVDVVASVLLGSTREPDVAGAVAEELSITPQATIVATIGGNTPQLLVNEIAARIQRGDLDVALVGGAEALRTRARRRAAGEPDWPVHELPPPSERIGDDRPGTTDDEHAHGLVAPVTVYPLFETALRGAAGRGVDEHQARTARLWAELSSVASRNPYAWAQEPLTAAEIASIGPDNRIVCWPYPKRMCARPSVDLGAALLLTSYEAARAAGVADDRIVFLHAGADAHDHWFVSERWSLAESPAIAAVGRSALGAAGLGVDDVARFDLYSCFPSAVQLALGALGLRGPLGQDERPITVTGGLGFAGGPLNNYVSHSIAAMVDACRAEPGSVGMTTGLGWYSTKHSAGVWSTEPPPAGYVRVDPTTTQAEVDATPRRVPAGAFTGEAVVEASQVRFGRGGDAELATVSAIAADGRRVLAVSADPGVTAALVAEAWEGRTVRIAAGEGANEVRA
jgi:acetyl-CoA C-acetyltransferase